MPSAFPQSERSMQSRDSINNQLASAVSYPEDGPLSNLDSIRYAECIHYLQEVRLSFLSFPYGWFVFLFCEMNARAPALAFFRRK
jgi:zinc finger FYVE domain-containing protein 26